jgi:murein DD-endopeptidase MepM/ murein hydrolase activator NlpD
MSPEGNPRRGLAEESRPDGGFDPGREAAYDERPRDHDLEVNEGAAPFEPGPGTGYDTARARRFARRQEKTERRQRRAEQAEAEARARAEAEARAPSVAPPPQPAAAPAPDPAPSGPARQPRVDAAALELERRSREQRERALAERRRRDVEAAQARERKLRERADRNRAARAAREEREAARAQTDAADVSRRLERERARKARAARARARAAATAGPAAPVGAPRRTRRNAAPRRAPTPAPTGEGPPAGTRAAAAPIEDMGPVLVPTASHHHSSLKRPTVKVAVALAVVSAIAIAAGSLLGLPLPVLGEDGEVDATQAAAVIPPIAQISPGTPVGLTEGPYHPVVLSDPDYGESAAKFGADRGGRRHEGQDVFARPGTPLVAVRDGVVMDGRGGRNLYSYGGGNTVVIYSPIDDRSYVYLHMLRPSVVQAGEKVKAGQLVGQVGCTGSCDGPHLHFEIREGRAIFGPQRKPIDPLPLLKRWPVRPEG